MQCKIIKKIQRSANEDPIRNYISCSTDQWSDITLPAVTAIAIYAHMIYTAQKREDFQGPTPSHLPK
jgi:hypothetical protein